MAHERRCASCGREQATQWHYHNGWYYCWACLLKKRCPSCYPEHPGE